MQNRLNGFQSAITVLKNAGLVENYVNLDKVPPWCTYLMKSDLDNETKRVPMENMSQCSVRHVTVNCPPVTAHLGQQTATTPGHRPPRARSTNGETLLSEHC